MKVLLSIVSISVLMAACTSGGGGGGEGGTGSTSSTSPGGPSPSPAPAPAPSPTPSPSPVPCSSFIGTKWIADGNPVTTTYSQDQAGHGPYVATFDLTPVAPQFTERYYSGPSSGTLTCVRDFNSHITSGSDPMNMIWTDTTGNCGVVIRQFYFDTHVCNKLTVTLVDSLGHDYMFQDYKPE